MNNNEIRDLLSASLIDIGRTLPEGMKIVIEHNKGSGTMMEISDPDGDTTLFQITCPS